MANRSLGRALVLDYVPNTFQTGCRAGFSAAAGAAAATAAAIAFLLKDIRSDTLRPREIQFYIFLLIRSNELLRWNLSELMKNNTSVSFERNLLEPFIR